MANPIASHPEVDRRITYVTLGLIGVVTCVSFIDRVMIGALAPQMKVDLDLSDTQLGLVAGFAFTFFYALCGLPLALVADRGSRRVLISVSVAVWSLATAACGLAQNFWHLLMARFLVGFGEAGAGPASFSLICDLFPEKKRAPAMSVYVVGAMMGTTLGLSLAGWIGGHLGWRWTFIILGLLGLLLAPVAWRFMSEPRRGAQDGVAVQGEAPNSRTAMKLLFENKPYVWLIFGNGLAAFCTYGMTLWLPSFMSRSHGLDIQQVAMQFGIPFGLSLMAGALIGGIAAGYLQRKDVHLLTISATCMFGITAFYLIALSMPTALWAIIFASIAAFLTGMAGPSYTAFTLTIVDARIRATAQAVVNFMNAVIAYAVGTGGVGILSDLLAPSYGDGSLRLALVIAQGICLAAGLIYLKVWLAERRNNRLETSASFVA